MDKEKIESERKELLEKLCGELQESLFPAMIREPQNPGEPVVMTILFDEMGTEQGEAFGEFCFRPIVTEEDEVQYFLAVITMCDDLIEEHLPALYEAASYVNYRIPSGSFQVDSQHNFLCFRLSAALPINISSDTLYDEMNIISGNAMNIVDAYYDLLMNVAVGELSVEDVISTLQ